MPPGWAEYLEIYARRALGIELARIKCGTIARTAMSDQHVQVITVVASVERFTTRRRSTARPPRHPVHCMRRPSPSCREADAHDHLFRPLSPLYRARRRLPGLGRGR